MNAILLNEGLILLLRLSAKHLKQPVKLEIAGVDAPCAASADAKIFQYFC